jgi:nitrate reductase NapE component
VNDLGDVANMAYLLKHEKEFILKSGLNIKLEPHPTIKDVGGYVFIVWKGKTMVD